jgi:hypothetical protein
VATDATTVDTVATVDVANVVPTTAVLPPLVPLVDPLLPDPIDVVMEPDSTYTPLKYQSSVPVPSRPQRGQTKDTKMPVCAILD